MANSDVLLYASEFPPGPGGIGVHAYSLAKALTANGYKVHVMADCRSADCKADFDFDRKAGFRVIRVKVPSVRKLVYFKRVAKLFSVIRSIKPSIVIASGMFPEWILGIITKVVGGRPKKIAIVHGTEVNYKDFRGKLTKSMLRYYDDIICVSEHTANLIRKNVDNKKIKIIPNGFDPGRFKSKQIKELNLKGNPVLLTVGSVTPRKGQHNVINALPHILKEFPDAVYHVVGMPKYKESFSKIARALNVEDKVVFHGAVSDEDLSAYYREGDIFLMLSETSESGDTEGFGIAILEANFFGKPAIGSKGCGIEDAIVDRSTGRIVDPKNPEEIVNAIRDILTNYEVYSNNAVKWAKKHTWDNVIKEYIKVIESS